jgi:hypothetical protein
MVFPFSIHVDRRGWAVAAVVAALFASRAFADAPAKVTFEDHIKPIFRNHCAKCHNPEEKNSDLDVMTFSSLVAGGASGQVVSGGDADASRLFKVINHTEEPKMPPDSPKIPDAEIDLVKAWIVGGLLEKADSKAMLSAKPKVNIALAAASTGQPTGPVAMPTGLLLEPVAILERPYAVSSIAASPWAPVIAIGAPKQILLFHAESLELLGILAFPEGMPQVLKFSRSGSLLLAGGGRGGQVGIAALYDVASGERILTVGEEFDTVLAADISSDQQFIALGGPGKLIKIYSTKTGELVRTIKKHTDWITTLEFSPDAVLLATGDRAGGLHVWETYSGQLFYTLLGHKAAVSDVSWRSDSNVLASASEDHTIWLWEMFNGTAVKNWSADNVGVLSIDFAKDGRIVSAGRDRDAKVWDGEGKGLITLSAFADLVTATSFSHDGSRVIAGDWSGEIRVYKTADGAVLGQLSMNPPTIAQRLAALDAKLPEWRAQVETLTPPYNAAVAAQAAAQTTADAAKQVLVVAQTAQQQADAVLADIRAKIEAGAKAVADAQASLEARRADAKAKADAAAAALAALEQTKTQLVATEQAIGVQAKLIDDLTLIAKEARDVAAAGQLNPEKLEQTAATVEQAVMMAKDSLATSQSQQTTLTQEVTAKTTAHQEADAAAKAAGELVPPAEKAFADASAALQAVQTTLPDAETAAANAKAKVDEVAPGSVAADQALATAVAATGQAKAPLDQATAALTQANADLVKWKVASVRITHHQAKRVIAEKEQGHAQLLAAVDAARQSADAVAGEIASFEKFIVDGPALLQERQTAINQAQAGIDAANAQLEAVKGILAKKEALRADFEKQAASVKAAADAEPTNQALSAALANANETLGLLVADRDGAVKGVADQEVVVRQAVDVKAAEEKKLADLNAELAATPAKIEALRPKLTEAQALVVKEQSAADAGLAEVNQAKAAADQIAGQIAQLSAPPASP